jgi:hypothetical protein
MVVFVKSAPSNCKVVLTTSRRSRLHQVKSHSLRATSQLVFICKDGVSFVHTHSSSAHILKIVAVAGRSLTKEKRGACLVLVCLWCFGLSLGIVLAIYY